MRSFHLCVTIQPLASSNHWGAKEQTSIDQDRQTAQNICNDVRNGDNTSLNNWFTAHYEIMYKFIMSKHRDITSVQEYLHTFYLELSSGNAFCQYLGRDGCSLKTYMFQRLKFRCIHSKSAEETQDSDNGNATNAGRRTIIPVEDIVEEIADPKASQEETLIQSQNIGLHRQIVYEALDRLSDQCQMTEDTLLAHWRLKGFSYKDMAKQLMVSKNIQPAEDTLLRETNRIRKRFTRAGGTLDKWEAAIKQVMREKGVAAADLFWE